MDSNLRWVIEMKHASGIKKQYFVCAFFLMAMLLVGLFSAQVCYAAEIEQSTQVDSGMVENDELSNDSNSDELKSSDSNIDNQKDNESLGYIVDRERLRDAHTQTETGLIIDSSGIRYRDSSGEYLRNSWFEINGETYYFGENTYAYQYEHWIDGKFYYFNLSGEMQTGWLTWWGTDKRSYFGSDGAAYVGLQQIDDALYYFDPNNRCATAAYEQFVDGKMYYFDPKNEYKAHKGWLQWWNSFERSYFDEDGIALSGWQVLDGKKYYFNPSDNNHTAIYETWINGDMYYFDKNGVMQTGWLTWWNSNQKSYFSNDGKAYKYEHWIDGKMYYFDPKNNCKTHMGWLRWYADGLYSYFSYNTGAMLTGTQRLDGIIYDFGSTGKTSTYNWHKASMGQKAQQYVSDTSYLILVDRASHKVAAFKGRYNDWTLQYYWSCVTGAPSTPTITGSYYTTGFKRTSLSTDSRAIWCTQIWGGYFFHSILASESELNRSLSHGCIRLPYSAADWIYCNSGGLTRVIIYN